MSDDQQQYEGVPSGELWYQQPPVQQPSDLTDAAAYMRDAAAYLRDAATPAAPAPERNWDWGWLTGWLRYSEHGKAVRRAAYSSGPAVGVLLWYYRHQTGHSGAAAAVLFFGLGGLANLLRRSPLTRWLMWGTILGPVFYPPALVDIVFGTVQILFEGK